jgi:hypothetical protein
MPRVMPLEAEVGLLGVFPIHAPKKRSCAKNLADALPCLVKILHFVILNSLGDMPDL